MIRVCPERSHNIQGRVTNTLCCLRVGMNVSPFYRYAYTHTEIGREVARPLW